MNSPIPRHSLLRQAFSEIPKTIGNHTLRPLSGGSFELLFDLKNPLVFGATEEKMNIKTLLAAVHEFIWIHAAPIEDVIAVTCAADIPAAEIRKIAMSIEIGEALELTTIFTAASLRMAAAMAEPDDDEASPGKPQTSRTGSPLSSLPAVPLETPAANVISSGTLPSSEPFNSSTPPPANQELAADGAIPLFALPTMTEPPTLPDPPFPPCDPAPVS